MTASQHRSFHTSDPTATVTLDRFDTALGELESLKLEYRAKGSAESDVSAHCGGKGNTGILGIARQGRDAPLLRAPDGTAVRSRPRRPAAGWSGR